MRGSSRTWARVEWRLVGGHRTGYGTCKAPSRGRSAASARAWRDAYVGHRARCGAASLVLAYTRFAIVGHSRLHSTLVGPICGADRVSAGLGDRMSRARRRTEADGLGEFMAKVHDIQILLVRCGATSWDEGGRLSGGGTGLPLCDHGRAGVEGLVAKVQGSTLGIVVAAEDDASVETARMLAGVTGARIKPAKDLGEVNLGLWEGLLRSELEERFPSVYRQWKDSPEGVLIPQGESVDEARQRLIDAFGRLLSRTRGAGKGVGIVLRPLAYLIVRSWLRGESLSEVWGQAAEVPDMEWHCVPRLKLRGDGPSTTPSPPSRAKAS
jgi:broad specificity phosphatase PhoE